MTKDFENLREQVRSDPKRAKQVEQFKGEAKRCEQAAKRYEADSGKPDLWNGGAAAAWRLAASRVDELSAENERLREALRDLVNELDWKRPSLTGAQREALSRARAALHSIEEARR